MKLGIQMGYGSKGMTVELVKRWGGGVAMLSPRVFQTPKSGCLEDRMVETSSTLRRVGADVLLDPMLYEQGDPLGKIAGLEYCKAMRGDLQENYRQVVERIVELNRACGTRFTVLPAITSSKTDDGWFALQGAMIDYAERQGPASPVIPTVALGPRVLEGADELAAAAERMGRWDVEGVYLVCERPDGDYLTGNPLWLCNLALLAAWLKRSGKKVLVGYASHQMLVLALAKCDYLFSGNYLNMRRFRSDDFKREEEDSGPSRRATWYYAPHFFSEFKVVTLDLAYQAGKLGKLATPLAEPYASVLFGGTRPSTTEYSESDSFKHYLYCLHAQCRQFSVDTYDGTLAAVRSSLANAESLIDGLRKWGIYDRDRSFADALPASLQAVEAFNREIGGLLSFEWQSL